MSDEIVKCEICGEPLPSGEEMFKFHGYSGPCPKPPLETKSEQPEIDPASPHAKISSALDRMRSEPKKTRELSLAITKAEECLMWLDRDSILNR